MESFPKNIKLVNTYTLYLQYSNKQVSQTQTNFLICFMFNPENNHYKETCVIKNYS